MTALHRHVADYLRLRRALGYRLERAGLLLPQLVDDLQAAEAQTVTTDLAIAWARLPQRAHPNHWAQRLAIARGFATYLQTLDPRAEVPPAGVFPTSRYRPAPYRWSRSEIDELIRLAGTLQPRLRALTFQTLFGLLVVTGMRLGEAVALTRNDVDPVGGVITIRHAKFDRVRLIPLHPTSTAALEDYAAERDRLCPPPRAGSFFLTTAGTPVLRNNVEKTLRTITTTMGIRTPTVHPRAHDLRHRFAVETLIGWYQEGLDVDGHMAMLSTYLGHVSPSDTYWYLSAVPELMALTAQRLEARYGARR